MPQLLRTTTFAFGYVSACTVAQLARGAPLPDALAMFFLQPYAWGLLLLLRLSPATASPGAPLRTLALLLANVMNGLAVLQGTRMMCGGSLRCPAESLPFLTYLASPGLTWGLLLALGPWTESEALFALLNLVSELVASPRLLPALRTAHSPLALLPPLTSPLLIGVLLPSLVNKYMLRTRRRKRLSDPNAAPYVRRVVAKSRLALKVHGIHAEDLTPADLQGLNRALMTTFSSSTGRGPQVIVSVRDGCVLMDVTMLRVRAGSRGLEDEDADPTFTAEELLAALRPEVRERITSVVSAPPSDSEPAQEDEEEAFELISSVESRASGALTASVPLPSLLPPSVSLKTHHPVAWSSLAPAKLPLTLQPTAASLRVTLPRPPAPESPSLLTLGLEPLAEDEGSAAPPLALRRFLVLPEPAASELRSLPQHSQDAIRMDLAALTLARHAASGPLAPELAQVARSIEAFAAKRRLGNLAASVRCLLSADTATSFYTFFEERTRGGQLVVALSNFFLHVLFVRADLAAHILTGRFMILHAAVALALLRWVGLPNLLRRSLSPRLHGPLSFLFMCSHLMAALHFTAVSAEWHSILCNARPLNQVKMILCVVFGMLWITATSPAPLSLDLLGLAGMTPAFIHTLQFSKSSTLTVSYFATLIGGFAATLVLGTLKRKKLKGEWQATHARAISSQGRAKSE